MEPTNYCESLFIQIPKMGAVKHRVVNITQHGIRFVAESFGVFNLVLDENVEIQLHLSPSLFFPMTVKVTNEEEQGGTQNIESVFNNSTLSQHQAIVSLLKLMEQAV